MIWRALIQVMFDTEMLHINERKSAWYISAPLFMHNIIESKMRRLFFIEDKQISNKDVNIVSEKD